MSHWVNTNILRAAICGIVVAGCRTTEPDSAPEGCSGPIQVAVLFEAPPRFDWAPECGISLLTVSIVAAQPEDDDPVWGFQAPENAPVGPAVTYGTAPDRAQVWTGPAPLVVGTRYRVWIAYTVGQDVVTASGERTFTWFPPD